jgi:hypothetical protein
MDMRGQSWGVMSAVGRTGVRAAADCASPGCRLGQVQPRRHVKLNRAPASWAGMQVSRYLTASALLRNERIATLVDAFSQLKQTVQYGITDAGSDASTVHLNMLPAINDGCRARAARYSGGANSTRHFDCLANSINGLRKTGQPQHRSCAIIFHCLYIYKI